MAENWKPAGKIIIEKPYPRTLPPNDSRTNPYPTRPRAQEKPLKPTRGSRRSR